MVVVVGCPALPQVANAWSQRNGDSVKVRCNSTSESFNLTCVNGTWVGRLGNCSDVTAGGLLYNVGLAMNYGTYNNAILVDVL
jgi:hypothetical protein